MKRSLPVDLSLVLSLATVLGMAMAVAGRWPAHELLGALLAPGLALVYLAGGIGGGLTIVVAIGQIFSPAPYGHPVERPIE